MKLGRVGRGQVWQGKVGLDLEWPGQARWGQVWQGEVGLDLASLDMAWRGRTRFDASPHGGALLVLVPSLLPRCFNEEVFRC